jgi:hypothetical protein
MGNRVESVTWSGIVGEIVAAVSHMADGCGVPVPERVKQALALAELKGMREPGGLVTIREAFIRGFAFACRANGEVVSSADLAATASKAADLMGYRLLPNRAVEAVFQSAEKVFGDPDHERDLYHPDWTDEFLAELARKGFKVVPDYET